ncbi:ROK family protein [Streptomyces sp. NPDC055749]
MNVAAVLMALREAGEATADVSGLAGATGLSRPAVRRALADLRDRGLVEFRGKESGQAQPGRPAQHVRFRAKCGHVAGIDIGPHKVLVAIADLLGTVVTVRRSLVAGSADGSQIFAILRETLSAAAADAGIPLGELWAVSVGTPGIVDRQRSKVLLAPSIPGWAGLPAMKMLEDLLPCPVFIDNDVNLASIAERQRGAAAATDSDSMVFVQWGRRIGCGIFIDGTAYRGHAAAAGELGFIDLSSDPDSVPGPRRGDGAGPFEQLVGAKAIHHLALTAGAPTGDEDDVAPLFEAAAAGEEVAIEVVERVAARFARGVAALVLLFDPGCVVIGGGVSRAGEVLMEPVRRYLRLHTLVPVAVHTSALGEEAVMLGAVCHALGVAEERMLDPTSLS